jgi:hypothetical protein
MASSHIFLSMPHAEAIMELGRHGPGGSFDHKVMAELLNLGLIEIGSEDRRVKLTNRGRKAFRDLTRG